ncbi:hypothetical protein LPW11_20365 [Geomonas sp. RF6]|uniref:hypothetical protein n=1 Tax=Geomonas sp. RF6 TaxID=2897342 RepID=UPI001E4E71A7|nr:hypothetical protein [Geomonas sp. RF6]UFS70215.1 hypothetical protein LPW11_20365 [Geomonas sp. RF6]
MSKHKHHKRAASATPEFQNQQTGQLAGTEMTPGREPAEGPDGPGMASPSHEAFEHHTADLDPVEGADID